MKKKGLLTGLGLVMLTVLAVGCGNDPTNPGNSGGVVVPTFFPWEKSTVPTHGTMYVTASRARGNGTVSYQSGGQIFKDTDHDSIVDGGLMTVSGLQITSHPVDHFYLDRNSATFGAVTSWGLSGNSGNGIPSFSDSLYVPSLVSISSPTVGSFVSKSANISLAWNSDANNDSVVVGFEYLSDASQIRDSTLPGTIIQWATFTEDDGSYSIPSSVLNSLPVGGLVRLVVARGNAKTTGTTSKKFYLYTYTYASEVVEVTQ